MWEELKKGNNWKGFVKNSTKSGKYYWFLQQYSHLHLVIMKKALFLVEEEQVMMR